MNFESFLRNKSIGVAHTQLSTYFNNNKYLSLISSRSMSSHLIHFEVESRREIRVSSYPYDSDAPFYLEIRVSLSLFFFFSLSVPSARIDEFKNRKSAGRTSCVTSDDGASRGLSSKESVESVS